MAIPESEKKFDMFSRFDTIPASDRQTESDRQIGILPRYA